MIDYKFVEDMNRKLRLIRVMNKLEKVTDMPGMELMWVRHRISILVKYIKDNWFGY